MTLNNDNMLLTLNEIVSEFLQNDNLVVNADNGSCFETIRFSSKG